MKETLNLLPTAQAPVKKIGGIIILSILLLAYLTGIFGIWGYNKIRIKRLNKDIAAESAQKNSIEARLNVPMPTATEAMGELRDIYNVYKTAPEWDIIMAELSSVVPDEVWLSSIDSKRADGYYAFGVKGFSRSYEGISSFISRLEASNHFYDVDMLYSVKGGKDISFELKTKIRWN